MLPEQTKERYFTVGQIARRRNLHSCTIRRMFRHESGVIVIKNPKPYKREYASLRIPESVEKRKFDSITNGGGA